MDNSLRKKKKNNYLYITCITLKFIIKKNKTFTNYYKQIKEKNILHHK